MASKLALAAQDHWRRVNAPHLVALVRAAVRFKDGAQVDEYHAMMEDHSIAQVTQELAA